MTKILKKSRIKWLTPKLQLRTNDSLTGSFPTNTTISSDRRNGNYGIFFDDTKTVNFKDYEKTSDTVGISMPSGLYSENLSLYRQTQTGPFIKNEELTTDLYVSGVIRKGVGDSFVNFERKGKETEPFQDVQNYAVDGITTQDPFYVSGSKLSDVGEGFNQPLWSKSKFEIDLSSNVSSSIEINNFNSGSNNFPMGYWNKDNKKWEGIGPGTEFDFYKPNSLTDLKKLWGQQCIGFSFGLDNGGSSIRDNNVGAVTSVFGFPFHSKYHASSSNLINVSDYITEPFLVEKIVLEFTGSLTLNNFVNKNTTKISMTTFFVLNQRKPFSFSFDNFQEIPYGLDNNGTTAFFQTGAYLPETTDLGYINDTRELVTYAQIVQFNQANTGSSDMDRLKRELNIISNSAEWTGNLVLSGNVKSPLQSAGHGELRLGDFTQIMLINKNSTRSGIFSPGGRDHLNTLEKGEQLASTVLNLNDAPVITLNRYSKINPYLLKPGDQLILGWQLPMDSALNNNGTTPTYNKQGAKLSFPPGFAKLVFYGSKVSENKETHDTLNQHLTSVSIHREIK